MLKVNLKRISTKVDGNLVEYQGYTTNIPEKNHIFMLFIKPEQSNTPTQSFATSIVNNCEYNAQERKFKFDTANSTYELTILDRKDPLVYSRVII